MGRIVYSTSYISNTSALSLPVRSSPHALYMLVSWYLMEASSHTEALHRVESVDWTVDFEYAVVEKLEERGEKADVAERSGERQEERVVFELRALRKEAQPVEASVGTADAAEDVDCEFVC